MTLYEHAKHLTALGFYVFPLRENKKVPLINDFTECSTNDPNDLARFWYDKILDMEHYHNIGIATSKFFGGQALLVVDVDNKGNKDGSGTMLDLELKGFEFPKTYTQKTPTGGLHYVYKVKTAIKQGVNVLGPGLDTRSHGGYIVGSGSLIDGKPYTDDNGAIAVAPQWMIDKCKEAAKRKPRKSKPMRKVSQKSAILRGRDYLINNAAVAIEGAGGDHTTFVVASKIKDLGVTQSNCLTLMQDHWNDNCQPPWAPDELQIKIENAYAYGQNEPGADSPEADFDPIISDKKAGENDEIDPIGELNKEFAFIVIGGKSTILRQTDKGQVSYMAPSAFHDLLKASTMQIGDGKKKQISRMWFDSHKRATYDSVELLPCKTAPKGVYNLWRGFTYEPLEKVEDATDDMREGVRLFKEHMLENVCLGNQELFDWLFSYFAHLIQKPWKKPRTALVFKGKKGVGKNALIDRIGHLFGGHYLLTSNRRYLTSNFNKHLANLVLFVLDEAIWSGDKQAEGVLKDLITGNSHLIEQKGREMYQAKNILRLVIIGNAEWVVPASEDERRFAVFNVGDKRQKDKAFFENMRVLLEKKEGNRLLMRELLDFKIKGIDINDAPDTVGLLEQKIESLNAIHSWWFSSLKEGMILNLSDFNEDWPATAGREQVRKAFLDYSRQRGIKSWLPDAAAFGRHFTQALPGVQTKRMREGENRQRLYILPTLSEARNQFEHFIGHRLEWDETENQNVIDIFS